MYSFDSCVRYSEVGEDKKLTLNGMINYFQDCSTFHSEELQVGVGKLEALQRVWVLSFWQIVIDRYPSLCERIRTSTWPYQFQGFLGWRNFTMTDGDGRMLAWANSLWTFLDTQTGRPARVPEEIENAYELEERLDMNYASRKLPMPKGGGVERENFIFCLWQQFESGSDGPPLPGCRAGGAVSYTHLDVYKRQDPCRRFCLRGTLRDRQTRRPQLPRPV